MPKIKKTPNPMGSDYIPTDNQRAAMVWCINNQIKMYPKAVDGTSWRIGIQIGKGKENVSPDAYGKNEIWEQMFNYYEYYYGKYREADNQTD